MHVRYDSVACAAELLPKLHIINNVIAGWRPAVRGALPEPARIPWTGVGRAMATEYPQEVGPLPVRDAPVELLERRLDANRSAVATVGPSSSWGSQAVCCYHDLRRVVHLSSDLKVSRCGNLSLRKDNVPVAGIVVAKASAADLAENSSFRLCRSCFGRCGPRAVGSIPHEDSIPPDSCVSPSVSSASSSLELSLGSDSGLGEA